MSKKEGFIILFLLLIFAITLMINNPGSIIPMFFAVAIATAILSAVLVFLE